jgi:hypothetical protein
MAKEQIQWASPPPLWPLATSVADAHTRRAMLRQPAILRFATDNFMNDFADMLDQDPARLVEYVARAGETWRGPGKSPAPLPPVPLFARTMNRLGLVAARSKDASLVPGGKGVSSLITTGNPTPKKKLKLYQPAHQRFYLVASSLVCERVGLPDHSINVGRHERATFVVRRMFPPGRLDIKQPLPPFDANTWEEYAFIVTPKGNSWRRIPKGSQTATTIKNEEQLPLFPMTYVQDDGRARKLLAGLIPVGKREAYMGAGFKKRPEDPEPVEPLVPPPDPRMHLFWSKITEPWKKLLEQAAAGPPTKNVTKIPDDPAKDPDKVTIIDLAQVAKSLKLTREQIQTGSWYVLLDFANLLIEQAPRVWRLLNGQSPPTGEPAFNTHEQDLVDALTKTTFDPDDADELIEGTSYTKTQVEDSLKSALRAIKAGATSSEPGQLEKNLEAVKLSYDRGKPDAKWPSFLFPLADPALTPPLPKLSITTTAKTSDLEKQKRKVGALAKLIEDALPDTPPADAEIPENPLVAQQPMDMREGWYVIRCVFERPECGPIDPPVLSDPSQPFQMAGFFDPDAPARPIRIALPLDTSPAGLRKFDKNTAFMISDMLCGQIDRLKGLTLGDLVLSVLPWPLHKDLPVNDGGACTDDGGLEIGMICSLSLPIITICALLMLMIIVFLLDIIFRWFPFFLFCFPLPKFKGKS